MKYLPIYIAILIGTLIGFILYGYFSSEPLNWTILLGLFSGLIVVFIGLIFLNKKKLTNEQK